MCTMKHTLSSLSLRDAHYNDARDKTAVHLIKNTHIRITSNHGSASTSGTDPSGEP